MKKLFLLFCFLPSFVFAASIKPVYKTYELDNGIKLIVIPNHKVPAVSHMVWYKIGAIDEVPGKYGLAHYLEHMMFKGTDKLKPGEFSHKVAKLGGRDNAFTTYDFTTYFQIVSKKDLRTMMAMEADRMQNLKFDETEAKNELQVILEERKMRYDNSPSTLLTEQLSKLLFPNHRYGESIIGSIKEIEGYTKEDVMEFYKKYYAPQNATLIIAGDVEPDEVFKLAKEIYGKVEKRKFEARTKTNEAAPISQSTTSISDSRVKQPEFMKSYRAPSLVTDKKASLALSLLGEILGGSDTSRFYKTFVEKEKLAATVNVSYDDTTLYDSSFAIKVLPYKAAEISKIDEIIKSEIDKIKTEGVTTEELEKIKNLYKAGLIYSKDSLQSYSYLFGQFAMLGLPLELIDNYENEIDAISIEDIKNAADKFLTEENSVKGTLMP